MSITLSQELFKADPENQTLSNLTAARIIEVDQKGNPIDDDMVVHCMFNPFEYTVSQSNSFKEQEMTNTSNTPYAELSKLGAQTLKLNLVFDTYEPARKADSKGNDNKPTDVTQYTQKLWDFMSLKPSSSSRANAKRDVPLVAFHWGVFYFISYITSMSQKFTLFTKEGIPVRAKVDVTFTQYADVRDYPKQNPTSGSDPIKRTWVVKAGDRLDLISHSVYHDPNKWRTIAHYNHLLDPLALRPGQTLIIPFEE